MCDNYFPTQSLRVQELNPAQPPGHEAKKWTGLGKGGHLVILNLVYHFVLGKVKVRMDSFPWKPYFMPFKASLERH